MGSRRTHEQRNGAPARGRADRRRDRSGDVADRARHRRAHARGDGGRDLRGDHRAPHRAAARSRCATLRVPFTEPSDSRVEGGRTWISELPDGAPRSRPRRRVSGLGVARALAAEGVQVAICGRNRDTVDEAAAGSGIDAVPIVADVSTSTARPGFVRDARAALGGIDILVLNAGGPPPGDFAHTTVDQYLEAFELNCRGAIAMCYEAVPEMRERKWGRVVAITSIAVRQPIPNLILSNTARAGLTGFLRTLAREVARDGVTVNSLLPGLHADRADRGAARRPRRPGRRDPGGSHRRSRRLRPHRRVRVLASTRATSPAPRSRSTAARTGRCCDPPRRRCSRSSTARPTRRSRRSTTRSSTLPARLPQLRAYAIGRDLAINDGERELRGRRRLRDRRRLRRVSRRSRAPTHHRRAHQADPRRPRRPRSTRSEFAARSWPISSL